MDGSETKLLLPSKSLYETRCEGLVLCGYLGDAVSKQTLYIDEEISPGALNVLIVCSFTATIRIYLM